MLITNCQIIFKDQIKKGAVEIKNGCIKKIYSECYPKNKKGLQLIDAKGMYLSPGFIDIHIHGAGGADVMEGTTEAISKVAQAIVKHGTTSFVPTTMTVSASEINQTVQAVKALMSGETKGAQVLGVHLEGPFVSPQAIGAQNPKYLLMPSVEAYKKLIEGCEDTVLSLTLAPELEGAKEVIEYAASRGVKCSAGHSKATYREMRTAMKWGISHITHLYNGMTPFTHREPGIVGAAFDSDMTVELIADGIHSDYPALRIACKQKTSDKIILITDAMMACTMPEGEYTLGGQAVFLKAGAARLANGVLAGSVLTLDQAINNVFTHCKLPLYEIVKMATYNPARFCKLEHRKGLIREGYDADLVLFDDAIHVKKVWIRGKECYSGC